MDRKEKKFVFILLASCLTLLPAWVDSNLPSPSLEHLDLLLLLQRSLSLTLSSYKSTLPHIPFCLENIMGCAFLFGWLLLLLL